MAKTATATKAKTGSGKSVTTGTKKSVTTTASSMVDELSALVSANKALEDEQRAQTGSQNSFITLAKANSGVVDPNNPAFIKGVKPLDYVITSKKLGLGKCLDVTILGMFKVYAEVAKKDSEKDMPKTVGFWMPDDAVQFPLTGIFDRELPNGNTLQPCHWVFVYLHKHAEIVDGLIPFQGKSQSVVYTPLEKLIKAESSLVTELRFKVTSQDVYNKDYKKTDYYPKFDLVGRNYKIGEDGKVQKVKDSDVDAETLKEILSRSKTLLEDYAKMRLVGKRNVQALLGSALRAALADKTDEYEDDDDAAVNF